MLESFYVTAFTFVTLSTKTPCLDFLIYIPLQLLLSIHSSYVNPNVLLTTLAVFSKPFWSLKYVLKWKNLPWHMYNKDASFSMGSYVILLLNVFLLFVQKALLLLTIEAQ